MMSILEQYQYLASENLETVQVLEGYDPSFTLCYYGNWSTAEEYAWLAVFEKHDSYFICNGGYAALADEPKEYLTLFEMVTLEYALACINDMEMCIADVQMSSEIGQRSQISM